MPYTPSPDSAFIEHSPQIADWSIPTGSDLETIFDYYDDVLSDLFEMGTAPEVADITALRALTDLAQYTASNTQVPVVDNQLRRVRDVRTHANETTAEGLYMFIASDSTSDADGDTGNIDTDGIVSPLQGPPINAVGRWFRIDGRTAIKRRGTASTRTMFDRLIVDLNTDTVTSDVAVQFIKRAAGSQVKILTNEEIAIRNAADSANEDLAVLGLTLTGNINGSGADNDLTAAPAASATDALLGLGADIAGGSVNGNFFGINVGAGYTGDFIHVQLNNANRFRVTNTGATTVGNTLTVTTGGASISGGALNMNTQLINNVVDPVSAQDAATKTYVDTAVTGGALAGYGDGSDGDITISSNTSLTRDMFYNNLTVNAGFTLNPSGFRIFVRATCTVAATGVIAHNGNTGTNGSPGGGGGGGSGGAGAAALAAGYFPAGIAGVAGGAGGGDTLAGDLGSNGNAAANAVGANGVAGTAGGAGGQAGGAGGAAGVATALAAAAGGIRHLVNATLWRVFSGTTTLQPNVNAGAGGGGGGGGGSGGGGNAGGGGGSGSSGGYVLIAARTIVNNGTISAIGGTGGNGGAGQGTLSGGGAGGSGGSGGIVITIAGGRSGSGSISVAGGAGGSGGAGSGAGAAGSAGNTGTAGISLVL